MSQETSSVLGTSEPPDTSVFSPPPCMELEGWGSSRNTGRASSPGVQVQPPSNCVTPLPSPPEGLPPVSSEYTEDQRLSPLQPPPEADLAYFIQKLVL